MENLKNKILNSLFKRNTDSKETYNENRKWVTCNSWHQTTYLKKGWSYAVIKEDDKWYWFNFDGKTMRYPKHYFDEHPLFI